MRRPQSIITIFAALVGIIVLAVLSRPRNNQGGFELSFRPADGLAQPPVVVGATNPSTGAAGPTPTIAPQTPYAVSSADAVFAVELQTPVAGVIQPPGIGSEGWNPPPLEVPLALHPFDHYWLIRPVAPNFNNFGLAHYAYGSDGPANDLRLHHGIDLANPLGVEVLAAGDGTVVWAGRGHLSINGEGVVTESITAYGNTVVIQHDFGYDGQPIFTLYAHLSALLVQEDQHVSAGHVLGLIGNTGQVTGSHVHFEVRVGRNLYGSVRNPELWVAPYVGTGVIAGRILDVEGHPMYDTAITVIDRATGQIVYQTATYAGSGVNSDDRWQETFVVPDMPAGRYLVTGRHDLGSWSGEAVVVAGMTNWVEMTPISGPRSNSEPTPTP